MADPLWINADSGAPAYGANELRQAMALPLAYDGRLLGARQGVRPGGDQLKVGLAGSTITVQPGVMCVDPALSTPQGPYWVAIPEAEEHTLTAAAAGNARKDIVVARVYDHDADSSGLRLARTEYIAGVAGPAPSEPAVPAGAVRIATIDVPASGGGSPVVTDRRRYTVAAGGILPVSADGDVTASTAGRYRHRLDTGLLEVDTGATWSPVADPRLLGPWIPYTPAWTSASGTNPSVGNGTLTGKYVRAGRFVSMNIRLTMGSSTSYGTGAWRLSLPVTAVDDGVGQCVMYDSSTAGNRKPGVCWNGSTTTLRFNGDTGDVDASNPFTWANGDQLRISFTYEAAS